MLCELLSTPAGLYSSCSTQPPIRKLQPKSGSKNSSSFHLLTGLQSICLFAADGRKKIPALRHELELLMKNKSVFHSSFAANFFGKNFTTFECLFMVLRPTFVTARRKSSLKSCYMGSMYYVRTSVLRSCVALRWPLRRVVTTISMRHAWFTWGWCELHDQHYLNNQSYFGNVSGKLMEIFP